MGVEVRVDLVEVDLDLAHAPERRLGHRVVGRGGRAHGVVGGVELLGLVALRAEAWRASSRTLATSAARALGLDDLVHHGQALEGVLAVEDAGLVDVLGVLAARVERAHAELAVDRGAADQQRELEPLLVQLLDRQRHLLGGRDEQRGEADRGRVVLLGGVEDRADRDLLAEVDDRVAVVGEDRVDERLADVVDVAEDGREHDGALRVALELVEVLLELGDRALHDLGALEHEGEDQLAGAELVADLLHGRQQHVVERRDRADLLDRLVDLGLDALPLAAQDVVVQRLLGLHARGRVRRLGGLLRAHRLEVVDEALQRVLAAVEDEVVGQRALRPRRSRRRA